MSKELWKEKNALAWSVAILAALWTWITSFSSIGLWVPPYVVFLTWASGFLAGGGFDGFKTSLTMNLYGAFWAYVGIQLGGALGFLGDYAMPVAVGAICLPLCWGAVFNAFSLTPCGFIGGASVFAVYNSVANNPTGAHAPFFATLVAIVLGNLTLFACVFLIDLFMGKFSKEGVAENV